MYIGRLNNSLIKKDIEKYENYIKYDSFDSLTLFVDIPKDTIKQVNKWTKIITSLI